MIIKYCLTQHKSKQQQVMTIDVVADLDEGHYEWFMNEFEAFTRRQELERAIMASADLLEER